MASNESFHPAYCQNQQVGVLGSQGQMGAEAVFGSSLSQIQYDSKGPVPALGGQSQSTLLLPKVCRQLPMEISDKISSGFNAQLIWQQSGSADGQSGIQAYAGAYPHGYSAGVASFLGVPPSKNLAQQVWYNLFSAAIACSV